MHSSGRGFSVTALSVASCQDARLHFAEICYFWRSQPFTNIWEKDVFFSASDQRAHLNAAPGHLPPGLAYLRFIPCLGGVFFFVPLLLVVFLLSFSSTHSFGRSRSELAQYRGAWYSTVVKLPKSTVDRLYIALSSLD